MHRYSCTFAVGFSVSHRNFDEVAVRAFFIAGQVSIPQSNYKIARNFSSPRFSRKNASVQKSGGAVRLKGTVAILGNKLHALLLTAARCLKERPHKAPLRLTTSTTSGFVCWRQKNNCTRDYAPDWKSKTLYWISPVPFLLMKMTRRKRKLFMRKIRSFFGSCHLV